MRLALTLAGCALLVAACTSDETAPEPLRPTTTTAPTTTETAAPTTTTAEPATRPTGPVDKACSLLTAGEVEHAFGAVRLLPEEKPPKGLGVAYRHSCAYVNFDVNIELDVLFARGQGGTEKKAIEEATAHREDVEPVPGVGAAAAYYHQETGDTSGFVAAKPLGKDSVMVIVTAKPHDHAAAKITFTQLGQLALDRIK